MTLTLMPSPITAVIAGSPARVAGILISRLGRSTIFHRSLAWAMVASVSRARPGSTSIETRPSTPWVAAEVAASTSQALRTSSVVRALIASSTEESRAASSAICSSYASPLASAEAKIVGLVVTPTTDDSATRSARLLVVSRSRERSSSQMDTPASARAFSRSLMRRSSLLVCCGWLGGEPQLMVAPGSSLTSAVPTGTAGGLLDRRWRAARWPRWRRPGSPGRRRPRSRG